MPRSWRWGRGLVLFLYPHSITGILSASSGHAVGRNAALLPACSFMLGDGFPPPFVQLIAVALAPMRSDKSQPSLLRVGDIAGPYCHPTASSYC